MMDLTGCSYCKGAGWVSEGVLHSRRPCEFCTDSGTPTLDYILGQRYAAGIDRDGRMVAKPHSQVRVSGTSL
jgi:hypothetical protein